MERRKMNNKNGNEMTKPLQMYLWKFVRQTFLVEI